MSAVFISYSSNDYKYAKQLYDVFKTNKINAWFAPVNIDDGGNFAQAIGAEMGSDDIESRSNQLKNSKVFILILSKHSMESEWVKKEIKMAIKKKMCIYAIQVDKEALTDEFEYLLIDIQIIEGYHLHSESCRKILNDVKKHVVIEDTNLNGEIQIIDEKDIKIHRIASGDPYYEEGISLSIYLSKNEFYLAPPKVMLECADDEIVEWCKDNGFVLKDIVFDENLDSIVEKIDIENLKEMIEESRVKIFKQFLNKENGCYFNNKKYGVERIDPFGRTIDESEIPNLEVTAYTTDYFTHRVMKDVCKKLVAMKNTYIDHIGFNRIKANKIFFTSMGINLVLSEDSIKKNCGILITSRSVNASETYNKQNFSLSVIEGVSISDYDTYQRKIKLTQAVERGLIEELNVKSELLQMQTLKFYDMFVNYSNLEMGFSCSIELKQEYNIADHVLQLRGRDEALEIADKRIIELAKLKEFITNNQKNILPQAIYTLCTFLENKGDVVLKRFIHHVYQKESCIFNKDGSNNPCGDSIVDSEHYIAVIDGSTPKGHYLWNNQRGDVFVSQLLSEEIKKLPPNLDAKDVLIKLNEAIKNEYEKRNIDFLKMPVEERLQASVLIYSLSKKQIWSFGDCLLSINGMQYNHTKKGDVMLADLRAFSIELMELKKENVGNYNEYGRSVILPFLKDYMLFANTNLSFGYDVLDGGKIYPEHVVIYDVQTGDHVVMATDGYPKLFDTIKESEAYLKEALEKDPYCIGIIRDTKGIEENQVSFDDRCYIGFNVE